MTNSNIYRVAKEAKAYLTDEYIPWDLDAIPGETIGEKFIMAVRWFVPAHLQAAVVAASFARLDGSLPTTQEVIDLLEKGIQRVEYISSMINPGTFNDSWIEIIDEQFVGWYEYHQLDLEDLDPIAEIATEIHFILDRETGRGKLRINEDEYVSLQEALLVAAA